MFSRRNLFQDIITHWFGIVLCILFKGHGVPILSQWKFANTWILCKNLLEPAKRTTFAASNWLPGTMGTTLSCPFWYPLDTCEKTRFIACAPNPVPHGIQDQNKILCGPVSAWIHESLKITPKNYVLSYLVPVGLNCYRVDFTKRNRKRCQQICFTPRCCEASIFLWANGSWNNVCEYVFFESYGLWVSLGATDFFFCARHFAGVWCIVYFTNIFQWIMGKVVQTGASFSSRRGLQQVRLDLAFHSGAPSWAL